MSIPDSPSFHLKDDEPQEPPYGVGSIVASYPLGKENTHALTPDKILPRKETGKLIAKICQDRLSKPFIIPASQKVYPISWARG